MDDGTLHLVMLPWLAMGHLIPFLELSKRLARKGHRISFLTTPKNIQRLHPKIPPNLSPLLHLVELHMPHLEHLPDSVENTTDLPSDDLRPYLNIAYNTFDTQLSAFLQAGPKPDWIIYDYAAHWAPAIAAANGIPCSFLSLFNAATLVFFGPTKGLGARRRRRTLEDFTKVPEWIPFPTTVAFRPYEARDLFKHMVSLKSESSELSTGLELSPFIAIRSCREFEQKWLELLSELYQMPIIPVGLFPPSISEACHEKDSTFDWLDKQERGSVVYAAFGSEVKLTSGQVQEIALGLELSGLPFVWALRSGTLPDGFEGRTEGRGIVCKDWVPQDRLLAHPSTGGFLTHGGWNSIVEGLASGVAMVLLPQMIDQGLNARYLVERGIGVEVPRDEEDGSFTGDGIAESLRLVMVEEDEGRFRAKTREYKEIFGDDNLADRCVGEFVEHLRGHIKQQSTQLQGVQGPSVQSGTGAKTS